VSLGQRRLHLSQLGKDPEPNIGELQRCLTACQGAVRTPVDEHVRQRPRDIRGMCDTKAHIMSSYVEGVVTITELSPDSITEIPHP
jgi:hypothetical protein